MLNLKVSRLESSKNTNFSKSMRSLITRSPDAINRKELPIEDKQSEKSNSIVFDYPAQSKKGNFGAGRFTLTPRKKGKYDHQYREAMKQRKDSQRLLVVPKSLRVKYEQKKT